MLAGSGFLIIINTTNSSSGWFNTFIHRFLIFLPVIILADLFIHRFLLFFTATASLFHPSFTSFPET